MDTGTEPIGKVTDGGESLLGEDRWMDPRASSGLSKA
jgi:hypothetical protein